MTSRLRGAIRCAAAAVVLTSVAAAQVVEVPTFPVGRATFSEHLQDVDVAAAPDGSFVVIWGDYSLSNVSGGDDHATTRRFAATGAPLGAAVRADTSAHVFDPRISADPNGGYVAAWQWIGNGDYLFFGQYLDGSATPTGSDFEVTLNLAGHPIASGTVIGLAQGPSFLWSENGFWTRSIDANRDRRGGDIRAGSGGYSNDVGRTADGGFVTVWTGGFDEAASMGRFFSPTGQPRTPAFAVGDDVAIGAVAAAPLGGAAMAVVRLVPGTNALELLVRRVGDDGARIDDLPVYTGADNAYLDPDLEFDALGNLYVAWTEYQNGGAQPVRARAFAPDGTPLGPPAAITTKEGAEVRIARLSGGSFATIWYWNGEASGAIVRLCAPGMATCGDGVHVAACEQCDDGAGNSNTAPDACRTDCRRARCGDAVIDTGEQCDDGNAAACDGCDAQCQVEPGFRCGDGVRSRACGEQCDDGAANSNTVPGACRADCRPARCGDGVVDAGEQCDDGNQRPCDGCSLECEREDALPDTDGNGTADVCDACLAFTGDPACQPRMIDGTTGLQRARFDEGQAEFLERENPATGLGPVFNGTRCAECHATPTVGGASTRTVTRVGTMTPDGSGALRFDPLTAQGGSLLQEQGITTAACSVPGEVVPPAATIVAHREAPPLFGLGLLEAIADVDVRLRREARKAQKDGVSPRYNTDANGIIGRFGWKAQTALLHDFAAVAYLDEMGITSPFLPSEHAPQGGPPVCDAEPEPEDTGDDVAAFTEFMALLAPPPPPPSPPREARRGRGVFRKLRCNTCHYEKYRTPTNHPVAALRRRRVLAYTDLLLHDMGPALADGIEQRGAGGSEFRTPPLWGVRFTAPYLHDGRAATLAEAIASHGGEGQPARDRYFALPADRQAQLIAFLETL